MIKSLIILLVIFAVLGVSANYIYTKYSKTPYPITQQTAKSIPKYPNSKSWQITDQKNLCVFATDECSQPSTINFQSKDTWSKIYHYYKDKMQGKGWSTNSIIITSVPSSIVFTNNNNCGAHLKKSVSFFTTTKQPKYTFTVTCNKTPKQ